MSLTVVIPAYNEARRIRPVIEAAKRAPIVGEIVVVDDGSSDHTGRVAASAGARVVRLGSNLGKGAAMLAGAGESSADILVFLDADLVGLQPEHVIQLAEPLLKGRADMTVGVFAQGRKSTDLAQFFAPSLSGQRAIKRSVFLNVPGLQDARYGVEVLLTSHARAMGLRVEKVTLNGVSQVMKEEKRGVWRGIRSRLQMYWDILRGLTKLV